MKNDAKKYMRLWATQRATTAQVLWVMAYQRHRDFKEPMA